MPAYNAAKYITSSIDSVINQIYSNWELIIIDDGSIDNTRIIISDIIKRDNRIKYFYQENGRQGKARNLGICNSTGKYIAFLDADDKWTRDKLKVQIKFLEDNSEIDLVFSQGYYLDKNTVTEFNVHVRNKWGYDDIGYFISSNQIPICSVILKKNALLEAGGFCENFQIQNVEDYHLWMKLLLNEKKFSSLQNRLFYYRIHNEQSTFDQNSISSPIVYMFSELLETFDLAEWYSQIISRVKWYFFSTKCSKKALEISMKMAQKQHITYILFKLIILLPKSNFKTKILFKLATLI